MGRFRIQVKPRYSGELCFEREPDTLQSQQKEIQLILITERDAYVFLCWPFPQKHAMKLWLSDTAGWFMHEFACE